MPTPERRAEDCLVLSEMDREHVFDLGGQVDGRLDLLSFGQVRETCPKCKTVHLKLILRQQTVRAEHLFCAQCGSCFDAHYTNGACALTI
ncbi:MAG TPA: hypothetical protein VFF16_06480 [Telluria sp.]|nr:hypothetical protein [Telluria sp.]